MIGISPDTCNSHSSWLNIGNFDYCVLNESVKIERINISPWNDPDRGWMTGRLVDLQLSVYADVRGQNGDAQFIGELYTKRLHQVFTKDQREARSFDGK